MAAREITSWETCFVPVPAATGGEAGSIASFACIPYLLDNLINVALMFAGIIAVFFIIWGGYKLIRSGGDPKQVDGARQTITYAIIGLIIIFLSYFIISFVATVTGVDCIKMIGFDTCKSPAAGHVEAQDGDFGCFKNVDDPNAADPISATVSEDPNLQPLCQPFNSAGNNPSLPIGGAYYSTPEDCVSYTICQQ